jgi:tetraacyldisaccharide 4'-kinase
MGLKRALPAAWYRKAPWLTLLQPLASLYGALATRRRQRLRQSAYRASVPVVVSGNISVGGTGKTPLTIALARELQRRGKRVVILSRGYGGVSTGYPLDVQLSTPVEECGDEALLLALYGGCPVLVDPLRSRAALYAETRYNPDVLLCDDGLQHYALARDVEIAVIDGARGFGNARLLPAGPLREPLMRLDEVTCVVVNGEPAAALPAFKVPHFTMRLRTTGLRALNDGRQLNLAAWQARFGTGPVHAVAGIGNPERFFQSLRELGFVIIAHAYADHQSWSRAELDFADGLPVLMTEKDAVKYLGFADERHWAVQVEADLPPAFFDDIETALRRPRPSQP